MISLILKVDSGNYPTSSEIAAQIDELVSDAHADGHVVDGVKLPYGYIIVLHDSGLTEVQGTFATYKGMKLWPS